MQHFFFNVFLVASIVFFGLGLVIAFSIAVLGYFRSAMSVAWNAWAFAFCFFCLAFFLSPALEDVGGEAPPGALSEEEVTMLSPFRDCTNGIAAVAARLEGLVEGSGPLSTAEMGVVGDLRYELWLADPDILYVPSDSEALATLKDLLSRARRRFREACDELPLDSGGRGAARKDYRAGTELLSQGERLLTDLEARLLGE